MTIPFNKPFLTGKETKYITDAVNSGKISGNGKYTKLCHLYFQKKFGFKKCLLTTSCTDALEMSAILLDIKPGDDVIIPSYTFVSTANAFVLRGANILFADSMKNGNPNIDANKISDLITPKTKAIVIVHYAGMACDMDKIMEIAEDNNIYVIEDSAQAVDSYHLSNSGKRRPLGSIGHLAAFSFHETKNIISGEGGMLVINDEKFIERAEIIWEKGTNRSAFFRGEVAKYGWMDIGSSFLPSEIVSAFLYAQLEELDSIQKKRKEIWNKYHYEINDLNDHGIQKPNIPDYATNNAHMYYLVFRDLDQRSILIKYLQKKSIKSVFHYISLHSSQYYIDKYVGNGCPNSDKYTNCLLRLPLYYGLDKDSQNLIISAINSFYEYS